MSRLASRTRGGRGVTLVTGTLTGSGTLSIPAGVSQVSLTGRGGDGGDSSWYDAGRPYIAPSGWVAPALLSSNGHGRTIYAETTDYSSWPTCADTPGSSGPANISTSDWGNGGRTDDFLSWDCPIYSTGYYSNPGQSYIAPSSGGGPYTGTSTTSTLNGVTRTWAGGYNTGGVGTTSTQTLDSTGAGQSMTYSIPGTGALSYSYEL